MKTKKMSGRFTGIHAFNTALKYVRNVACGPCPWKLKKAVIKFIGNEEDMVWKVKMILEK